MKKMINEFFMKFKCEKCGNITTVIYPIRNIKVMVAGLESNKPRCACGNKNKFLIIGISNVD